MPEPRPSTFRTPLDTIHRISISSVSTIWSKTQEEETRCAILGREFSFAAAHREMSWRISIMIFLTSILEVWGKQIIQRILLLFFRCKCTPKNQIWKGMIGSFYVVARILETDLSFLMIASQWKPTKSREFKESLRFKPKANPPLCILHHTHLWYVHSFFCKSCKLPSGWYCFLGDLVYTLPQRSRACHRQHFLGDSGWSPPGASNPFWMLSCAGFGHV